MSWKSEVLVQGKWVGNAVRFATKDEAHHAGVELLSRWFVPDDHCPVESDDPVNYRFDMEKYRAIPLDTPA